MKVQRGRWSASLTSWLQCWRHSSPPSVLMPQVSCGKSPPPAIPSLAEDFCFGRSGLLTFSQFPESSLPRGGELGSEMSNEKWKNEWSSASLWNVAGLFVYIRKGRDIYLYRSLYIYVSGDTCIRIGRYRWTCWGCRMPTASGAKLDFLLKKIKIHGGYIGNE